MADTMTGEGTMETKVHVTTITNWLNKIVKVLDIDESELEAIERIKIGGDIEFFTHKEGYLYAKIDDYNEYQIHSL